MRSGLRALLGFVALTPAVADARSTRCALGDGVTLAQVRAGACSFNLATRRFAGTPAEQAKCLLRQVKQGRHFGLTDAPDRLLGRAGTPFIFSSGQIAAYLQRKQVAASAVGFDGSAPVIAEYFVIHDTSFPNCSELNVSTSSCPQRGSFPTMLNDSSWKINQTFGGHKPPASRPPIAHAWTNRLGESIIETPFETHISHVKFDYCDDAARKNRLFIGVENIQPRLGVPALPPPGHRINDLLAPTPGFSDAQYDRLALLYAVASARRGHWLIPAFHAVIDAKYADGHDDPQHFEIAKFDMAVANLVAELSAP